MACWSRRPTRAESAHRFLEKVSHEDFKNWCMLRLDIRENYARDENGVIQK